MKKLTDRGGPPPAKLPRRRKIRVIIAPEGGMTAEWLSALPETCWVQLRMDTVRQMLAQERLEGCLDASMVQEVD